MANFYNIYFNQIILKNIQKNDQLVLFDENLDLDTFVSNGELFGLVKIDPFLIRNVITGSSAFLEFKIKRNNSVSKPITLNKEQLSKIYFSQKETSEQKSFFNLINLESSENNEKYLDEVKNKHSLYLNVMERSFSEIEGQLFKKEKDTEKDFELLLNRYPEFKVLEIETVIQKINFINSMKFFDVYFKLNKVMFTSQFENLNVQTFNFIWKINYILNKKNNLFETNSIIILDSLNQFYEKYKYSTIDGFLQKLLIEIFLSLKGSNQIEFKILKIIDDNNIIFKKELQDKYKNQIDDLDFFQKNKFFEDNKNKVTEYKNIQLLFNGLNSGIFKNHLNFLALKKLNKYIHDYPETDLLEQNLILSQDLMIRYYNNFYFKKQSTDIEKIFRYKWINSNIVAEDHEQIQDKDVCVILYSCNHNLKKNVSECFETWFNKINCEKKIIVGKSDDENNFEIPEINKYLVRLDAGDFYEDLPKKTLAMIKWFLINSKCQYLFKIDDDCFLNYKYLNYFLNNLTGDYVGKIIKKVINSDRSWHQIKSKSDVHKNSLDLSPSKSIYCDGGCGYFLSRKACERILKNSETMMGKILINNSYYEDKLVGDLLSLNNDGIVIEKYPFPFANFRKNNNSQVPVAKWGIGMPPHYITPSFLVHTDNIDEIKSYKSGLENHILPKLNFIFDPKQKLQTKNLNDFEYEIASLQPIREIIVNDQDLCIILFVKNDKKFLASFINYYSKIGVDKFLIIDSLSEDGSIDFLMDFDNVGLYSSSYPLSSGNNRASLIDALNAKLPNLTNYIHVNIFDYLFVHDKEEFSLKDILFKNTNDIISTNIFHFYNKDFDSEDLDFGEKKQFNPFNLSSYVDKSPFFRTNDRNPCSEVYALQSTVLKRLQDLGNMNFYDINALKNFYFSNKLCTPHHFLQNYPGQDISQERLFIANFDLSIIGKHKIVDKINKMKVNGLDFQNNLVSLYAMEKLYNDNISINYKQIDLKRVFK